MISYLKGKIIKRGGNFVILNNADIGYKIFVGESAVADLINISEAEFWIYQNIREDANELYGFSSYEKLEMFELLLDVNGIGPKSAMGIMTMINVEELKEAIATGDLAMLNKVSGIGKKTAERIIIDLRDKIGFLSPVEGSISTARGEEIEALMALGYSLQQSREALGKIDKSITDSGQRIREALRVIKS
ncbi:MAG: Holliday junction branch migration protein RuvA [Patescibacteria group bacterium]|jgi:Holliday junction DNA helicase RuvA